MNKERLLNVAQALRESPNQDRFTMRQFVYAPDAEHTCGSPACALGHYAFRGDLQKTFTPDSFRTGGLACDAPEVQEHFGITSRQACQLFSAAGCGEAQTTSAAAEYIEKFVATDGKHGLAEWAASEWCVGGDDDSDEHA